MIYLDDHKHMLKIYFYLTSIKQTILHHSQYMYTYTHVYMKINLHNQLKLII